MNRDNIREMLADLEEAVTEASLPRYRNDNEGDATVDTDLENLKAQVLRVAAASTEEIDRVILELQGVRDTLRSEGERLNRELDRFANITHAAKTATKSIRRPPQAKWRSQKAIMNNDDFGGAFRGLPTGTTRYHARLYTAGLRKFRGLIGVGVTFEP
jgi:hypothetical protein